MINILFHGASVTQQSGETSYFQLFQNMIADSRGVRLRKKGYGGCHLDDAGFLTIDTDTYEATDVCILEWNTTGLAIFDDQKLRYIAGVLLDKNITPVFLLLARRDNISNNRRSEMQVIDFCRENGLLCLDYRHLVDPDTDLRDVVHTNELGAKIYADHLYADLFDAIPKLARSGCTNFLYKKFRINSLRDLLLDVEEGHSIFIDIADIDDGAQVILETIRGPSSPIVEVNGLKKICFWDQWSHFDRPSVVVVVSDLNKLDSKDKKLVLNVLADKIDYSSCVKHFNFDGVKELKIRGVHGIDCSPTLISCD